MRLYWAARSGRLNSSRMKQAWGHGTANVPSSWIFSPTSQDAWQICSSERRSADRGAASFALITPIEKLHWPFWNVRRNVPAAAAKLRSRSKVANEVAGGRLVLSFNKART